MAVLEKMEPQRVWYYFEEISKIPRASYQEKEISDYVCNFARERGLEYYQDSVCNVIIIKEATPGYEEKEPYIIQGHLDMVCEKTKDCTIDFAKDGLELAVDGDFIYAKGTTLGGDDGIAVAYALAILEAENISHPRLEVVLTVAEEVGMDGAREIDLSRLKGHQLLNLDSEEEGIFLTSCAGGCVAECHFPLEREEKEGILYHLRADGMAGGHSGCEIDKNRANATLVLARILLAVKEECHLVDIEGGKKDNAIPRTADMKVLVLPEKESLFLEKAEKEIRKIQGEYQNSEPNLFVEIERKKQDTLLVLKKEIQKKVVLLLNLLPNGVQSMSAAIKGLVETSLNMGVCATKEKELFFCYSIRSSIGSAKENLAEKIRFFVEEVGGSCEVKGDYPAWEYRKDSPLRERMISLYQKMYGKLPQVQAIHAGLECGLLAGKVKDLDLVSFGPDIFDIHTVEEKISISSTGRVWQYLLALLAG